MANRRGKSGSSERFFSGCYKITADSDSALVAQMVKNLSAMQETRFRFLGREDPLEKGMATHSRIFGWRIPWTQESGRLQSMGSLRVGYD